VIVTSGSCIRFRSFNFLASMLAASALDSPPTWTAPKIGNGTSPLSETRVMKEKSGASKTLMCTVSPGEIGSSESPPIELPDAGEADDVEPLPWESGIIAGRCSWPSPRTGRKNRTKAKTETILLRFIVFWRTC
jgi:hypothetical protein